MSGSMETLSPDFEARFVREHGSHEFALQDGTPVTVLSQPRWEDFEASFLTAGIPEGSYVLTPELMTAPFPPSLIDANRSEIMQRVIQVQTASTRRPDVTIALGTPTFEGLDRPKNSVVFIRDGLRIGSAHKRMVVGQFEGGILQGSNSREAALIPGSDIAVLICADMIMAASPIGEGHYHKSIVIPDEAKALLVNACWATPLMPALDRRPQSDQRYLQPLLNCAEYIFGAYPNLQDIVVADRSTPASGLDAPFNAHFKRSK